MGGAAAAGRRLTRRGSAGLGAAAGDARGRRGRGGRGRRGWGGLRCLTAEPERARHACERRGLRRGGCGTGCGLVGGCRGGAGWGLRPAHRRGRSAPLGRLRRGRGGAAAEGRGRPGRGRRGGWSLWRRRPADGVGRAAEHALPRRGYRRGRRRGGRAGDLPGDGGRGRERGAADRGPARRRRARGRAGRGPWRHLGRRRQLRSAGGAGGR